jgi:uncharacterized membrane protein YfcA
MAGIGLVIGLLNGFFGVGGGFMIVPALVLLLGFPARLAIGTSLSVIALMSLGGILGHWQFGDIDARLTVMVAMGSAAGILAGARLGNVLSPAVVRRVTAFVTVTIATFLITINSLKLLGWPHE